MNKEEKDPMLDKTNFKHETDHLSGALNIADHDIKSDASTERLSFTDETPEIRKYTLSFSSFLTQKFVHFEQIMRLMKTLSF